MFIRQLGFDQSTLHGDVTCCLHYLWKSDLACYFFLISLLADSERTFHRTERVHFCAIVHCTSSKVTVLFPIHFHMCVRLKSRKIIFKTGYPRFGGWIDGLSLKTKSRGRNGNITPLKGGFRGKKAAIRLKRRYSSLSKTFSYDTVGWY